jgi:hypothetical protein
MIVYRCDLCGEVRDCGLHQIDNAEYDLCAECWEGLMARLQGKGRSRKGRETVTLPAIPETPAPAPDTRPPFRQPPTIVADAGIH